MPIRYWKHTNIIVKEILKDHHSVVATDLIKANELIFEYQAPIVYSPTKFTLQIDEGSHIDSLPEHEWRYLNHSCDPNAKVADVSVNTTKTEGKFSLIALRDILNGEEITFNYNTTEFEISSPFECNCQTAQCLEFIKGYKYLSNEEKNKIAKLSLHYVLNLDKKSNETI